MLQRTGATVVSFRQSAGIALSRALILTKMTALLDYWLAVGIPGAGVSTTLFLSGHERGFCVRAGAGAMLILMRRPTLRGGSAAGWEEKDGKGRAGVKRQDVTRVVG